MEWNNDHPEREITIASDSYTFLVGSDSHVGGTDNISQFIEAAISKNPIALAISGDVTTGREEDYEVAAAELEALSDIQLCLVPGNHDLYFGGWNTYYELFGPSTYTLTIHTNASSDLYIFLDTGGGTLGTSQLEWLRELLEKERANHRHAIVVTHVNFFRPRFTNSTNLLNEELILLIDLFEKNEVNMVIQGHDHKRFEEHMGHTTYLTLDALKDGTKNASYLELVVSGEEIDYSFIDL
jgi:3',5'-cyclic AMP phosphodiesterase CpdA